MLKNIIFDFDDTLTDKKTGVCRLVDDYLSLRFPNMSIPGNVDAFKSSLHQAREKNTASFLQLANDADFGRNFDPRDFEEFYWKHSQTYFTLRDGVEALITRLQHHKYHVGVITDGRVKTQKRKLKETKIDRMIDNIVITDSIAVGMRKPHRQIIEYYVSQYHVNVDESVYIGDDPIRDIIGMKQLGLKTIWMANDRRWVHTHAQPDWIIHKIPEVYDCLCHDKNFARKDGNKLNP